MKLAAALVVGAAAAVAHAGWWDDVGAARRVSMAELRRDPDLYRDVPVLVEARFERFEEPGNPYFTRFNATEWRALSVVPSGCGEPCARFFVRKGSAVEERLASRLAPGRTELRALVRESARGEPWIEVVDATQDRDPFSPEESDALDRGRRFLSARNPDAALDEFRRLAARRDFADADAAVLWRAIGAAAWDARRIDVAADAFAAALRAVPDDAATAERLAAARGALRAADEASRESARAAARRLLPPSGLEGAITVAEAPAAVAPAPPPVPGPAPSPASAEAPRPPRRDATTERPGTPAAPASAPPPPAPVAEAPPPPPPPPGGPPEPPPPPPPSRRTGGLLGPK